MVVVMVACAALAGGCVAWVGAWALWRRRLAVEEAGRARERFAADVEHRSWLRWAARVRRLLEDQRAGLLCEAAEIDLMLWEWEGEGVE